MQQSDDGCFKLDLLSSVVAGTFVSFQLLLDGFLFRAGPFLNYKKKKHSSPKLTCSLSVMCCLRLLLYRFNVTLLFRPSQRLLNVYPDPLLSAKSFSSLCLRSHLLSPQAASQILSTAFREIKILKNTGWTAAALSTLRGFRYLLYVITGLRHPGTQLRWDCGMQISSEL